MRVSKCMEKFKNALLPDVREELGRTARRCVCREIKQIIDFT